MRFRLVPNSVTLDDFERRKFIAQRPLTVAFGADYVKVVELKDTHVLSAVKIYRP